MEKLYKTNLFSAFFTTLIGQRKIADAFFKSKENHQNTIHKVMFLLVLLSVLFSQKVNATTQSCTTGGDQVTYGSDSWIGYVYGVHNGGNPPSDAFTTTYRGYVTNTENFNQDWGNDGPTCATSYDKFAIRYLMKKNYPAGVYKITTGSDDGRRFYIGTSALSNFTGLTYNYTNWVNTGYGTTDYVLEWSGGDMYIVYEYYEQSSGARCSFNICYEGPLQTYGTSSWNGYFYQATDYNTTNYAGKLASAYYNTNSWPDVNRTTGNSNPPLDAAPSGTTACYSSKNINFATRYLMNNNFTRSFYMFTIDSDDGIRVSTQGPATWSLGSSPSSWDIFDNWKQTERIPINR